ncbi:LysR family transcriptional regulator [Yoonia sp. SS1-5]|uniref:LysR family transcriptional regulator n=1 Tax=Yoonia rhodophyticola TaxID=3137370 RepID=A0AAN0MAD1_9RHOB
MKDVIGYLRCFEAASRLMNFTYAADELCVTQSAVSHQMKELSRRLGFALFNRTGNTLELTAKGQEFARLTSRLLQDLDIGLEGLRSDILKGALLIHCDPVLANKWLLPRLDRLEGRCLPLRVELRSSGEPKDADIVIGFEAVDGFEESHFDADYCTFVYSPEILTSGENKLSPAQIISETAIQLGKPNLEELYGAKWSSWGATQGKDIRSAGDIEAHGSVELALQAAVHGRGVALLRRTIADDDIRAGRLIAASHGRLPDAPPLIVSINTQTLHHDLCRDLENWLLAELTSTVAEARCE